MTEASIVLRRRTLFGLLAAVAGLISLAAPALAAAAPGGLDKSFGTGGVTSLAAGTQLNGVAVQPGGGIVAVGASGKTLTPTSLFGERFSASGARVGSFGAGSGVGRAVVVQADGKFVLAGNDAAGMLVERFNPNGSLDTGFGSRGVVHAVPGGQANAIALGPNGTIIVAGQVLDVDGFQRIAILRLRANGSPDTSLGARGVRVVDLGQDSIANGVAVQGDSKIIIAGRLGPGAHQITNAFVARLTSGGAPDSTFGTRGIYEVFPKPGSADIEFRAVTIDPAGAIVIGGATTAIQQSAAVFTRLTCSGRPDGSFAGGALKLATSSLGFSSTPYGANGVAVVAGRRVIGAGQFQASGLAEAALWGFQSNGSAAFATRAPLGARSMALAVDSSGNLVVAGSNVPAGFLPSGFVARYVGFGGPASGSSPCGGPVVPPAITPTLTNVSQSHRVWALTKSNKRSVPVGTTFFFTLNTAARVQLAFTQQVSGRMVNNKCVAQTKRNQHKPRCTQNLPKGSFSVAGTQGKNSVPFNGRIPRSNTLKPGAYTVTFTATSASGGKSKSQSLKFVIVG